MASLQVGGDDGGSDKFEFLSNVFLSDKSSLESTVSKFLGVFLGGSSGSKESEFLGVFLECSSGSNVSEFLGVFLGGSSGGVGRSLIDRSGEEIHLENKF